jgi:aspartate/methionine/tyrosine aminotransferase
MFDANVVSFAHGEGIRRPHPDVVAAGIRIGWGCGPSGLIRQMSDRTTSGAATIPQLAKLMALAALRSDPIFLRDNRLEYELRARLIRELVATTNEEVGGSRPCAANEPVVRVAHDPHAGHSILLDFQGINKLLGGDQFNDSVELTRYFLKNAKVAFSPGFSIGHEGLLLRCNFASLGTADTFQYSDYPEVASAILQLRHC